MKYVYVLLEEGSWDYEFTNHTEVYAKYEDALKSFKNLVKSAKLDMKEWTEDAVEIQHIDKDTEQASFEIYEDGDFTRLHDTITILRKEVM